MIDAGIANIEPNTTVIAAPVVLFDVTPRYRNSAARPSPAPSCRLAPVARRNFRHTQANPGRSPCHGSRDIFGHSISMKGSIRRESSRELGILSRCARHARLAFRSPSVWRLRHLDSVAPERRARHACAYRRVIRPVRQQVVTSAPITSCNVQMIRYIISRFRRFPSTFRAIFS